MVRDLGVRISLITRIFVAVDDAGPGAGHRAGLRRRRLARGPAATLTVGTLVALGALLLRLLGPLQGLSNVRIDVMTALVSFERVFEVLDLPSLIEEKPDAVALPPAPPRLEFDHVAFRYPRADEVSLASLETVARTRVPRHRARCSTTSSFTAEPGQMVALVGPSGRRQDHDHPPGRPALRRRPPARSGSAATTCAT